MGVLPLGADVDILAAKFHTKVTEKWGTNLERRCGLA